MMRPHCPRWPPASAQSTRRRRPAARCWLLPAVALLWLAGCSAGPDPVIHRPHPPKPRPADTVEEAKRPRPYKVAGTWYHPMSNARGYQETGLASWYGKPFHGRSTSSGEKYDMYGVSAAHKTLPLGTWVRVRNLENGQQLDVRINDRGPFVQGRIIDLSYGAARQLAVVGPGTAKVEIVALGGGKPSGTAPPSDYTPVDFYSGNYTFQVGAFRDPENARRLVRQLDRRYKNVHITPYMSARLGKLFSVRVGRSTNLDQAEKFKETLRRQGFDGAFTVAED
jgi:rare lipoprotein A